MTFPIKKKINAELFIDVQKGDKETDQAQQPVWNDLQYMEGKTN